MGNVVLFLTFSAPEHQIKDTYQPPVCEMPAVSPPQRIWLLEVRVDQESLEDLLGLFYLVDLQVLVVLEYLQSHIHPAEHHNSNFYC